MDEQLPIAEVLAALGAEEDQARAYVAALAERTVIYRQTLIDGGLRPDEAYPLVVAFHQALLIATLSHQVPE